MTMNRSMPSDWTSSLGNGGAIGTGQRAGDPSTGGSAITEARDTFQGTRERLEGTAQASNDSTHAVDGTGYAGTNEDVGQSSEHHESGRFSGLTNSQYGHDAKRGDKGEDVANVELMSDVGYASLASPMGAAITSLMRNPAGEIKQPTTLSASPPLKENYEEFERTTNKGVEILARKERKENESKRKKVERYVVQNTNFGLTVRLMLKDTELI